MLAAAPKFILYFIGVLCTSCLSWLAFFGLRWEVLRAEREAWFDGLFELYWFVPMPYVVAWLIVKSRIWLDTIVAILILGVANFVISWCGLFIGFITLSILAVPAILVGYWCLGSIFAVVDTWNIHSAKNRFWVHAPCLLLAALAAYSLLWLLGGPRDEPLPERAAWSAVGVLALGFSGHALVAWTELTDAEKRNVAVPRVAVLLATAFMTPAAFFTVQHPRYNGLAWPFLFHQAALARAEEADYVRSYGLRVGKALYEGAEIQTRFGDHLGSVVVPEGWMVWRPDVERPGPVTSLYFLREPLKQRLGLTRTVRVTANHWRPLFAVRSDSSAAEVSSHAAVGCDPNSSALNGLIACRRVQPPPWLNRFSPALTGKLPEAALTIRMTFPEEAPFQGEATYSVFGPSFYAECDLGRTCRARLRQGERVGVLAEFDEADLARWQDIRTEVNAVLLSATGQGLSEGPPLLGPGGEALPF